MQTKQTNTHTTNKQVIKWQTLPHLYLKIPIQLYALTVSLRRIKSVVGAKRFFIAHQNVKKNTGISVIKVSAPRLKKSRFTTAQS